MRTLKIVDSHEHFHPWEVHKDKFFSFYDLMIPYTQFDLISAGFPKDLLWKSPADSAEAEQYWQLVKPLWPKVKHGSFAQVPLLAMKEFYGIEDLTDDSVKELEKLLNRDNNEENYYSVLKEKCGIKVILDQVGKPGFDNPLFRGAIGIAFEYASSPSISVILDKEENRRNWTFKDYSRFVSEEIRKAASEGAVLVKLTSSMMTQLPDWDRAEEEFRQIREGNQIGTPFISACLADLSAKEAADLGIVACVHSGVWGDLTLQNPDLIFKYVERHPETTFDIYHMGHPYVYQTAYLAKNYANAYLNLCWAPTISPVLTARALDVWLDLVPVSKIIGFGGDMNFLPQTIWAAQEQSYRVLSDVFARRVSEGRMKIGEAEGILEDWLYNVPAKVYSL